VDPQLKQLMKELGPKAINESLADSEQMPKSWPHQGRRLRYFLVLEATIGVSKQGVPGKRQNISLVSHSQHQPRAQIS